MHAVSNDVIGSAVHHHIDGEHVARSERTLRGGHDADAARARAAGDGQRHQGEQKRLCESSKPHVLSSSMARLSCPGHHPAEQPSQLEPPTCCYRSIVNSFRPEMRTFVRRVPHSAAGSSQTDPFPHNPASGTERCLAEVGRKAAGRARIAPLRQGCRSEARRESRASVRTPSAAASSRRARSPRDREPARRSARGDRKPLRPSSGRSPESRPPGPRPSR